MLRQRTTENVGVRTIEIAGATLGTYNRIGKAPNILLFSSETQPYSSHHDGQTHIHCDSNAIGNDVAITLDEAAVYQGKWYQQWVCHLLFLLET
jgi:hypothetical protein